MVRKHYIFHGRVQGVGFRITVYQMALRLGLTGWVRNQYDGNVEACFQGEQKLIDQLIQHMQSIRYIRIEKMDIEDLDILQNEKVFDIKYEKYF